VPNLTASSVTSSADLAATQMRRCLRVEEYEQARTASGSKKDFALVRLASPLPYDATAKIRREVPKLGAALTILGYPSGLPLKAAANGRVVSVEGDDSGYFGTDLDSFSGDSGAPVFDSDGALVGMMLEGQLDYVVDEAAQCGRPKEAEVMPKMGLFERVVSIGAVLGRSCGLGIDDACGALARAIAEPSTACSVR
jgi:hypothetical protein